MIINVEDVDLNL